jgi:F0F1-type ATP synthase membrane subunit b/b'
MAVFKTQETRQQQASQARATAAAEARTRAQAQVQQARSAIQKDKESAQSGLQAESGRLAEVIIRTVLRPAMGSNLGNN